MNIVLFQEKKQHINIKLNQSYNYCLYTLESKGSVPMKLLQPACYYFYL